MDLLCHLIENTELIPLVKGVQGAGKTTLAFQLQALAAENWMLCRISANPMLHPDQLLSRLADELGVSKEDDRLEEQLVRHLDGLCREGILPIVLIDDAHLLPVATVAMLLRLHEPAGKHVPLMRVILFALPAMDDLLLASELQATDVQTIQALEIPALNREQTEAYITHVLASHDAVDAFGLASGQVDRIYQASQGLPGRIEALLMKRSRQEATTQDTGGGSTWKPLFEGLSGPFLAGSFTLIVVVLLLLAFQQEINALFNGVTPPEGRPDQASPDTRQTLPLALPPLAELSASTAVSPFSPSAETETLEEPAPVQNLTEATVPSPATAAIEEEISKPTTALVQAPLPAAIVSDEKETKADTEVVPESEAATATATATASMTEAPAEAGPAPTGLDEVEVVPEQVLERPQEAAAPETPAPLESKNAPRREAWLLQQKPTAYTLQLISLQSEQSIQAFIERHGLQGKAAYFQGGRQGRHWFALLYGLYPDRKTAVAARSSLPGSLRRPDIWPRSLASVHKEIRAR